MATRHGVAEGLRKSDFGMDEQRVRRQLLDPKEVEFARGGALEGFVAKCMAVDRVRVKAAAGSGKSVHLPPAMVKGGVKLLVHCVPSKHLAASLHAFVPTQYEGLECHFIDDVVDVYPSSGIVYTNSSAFIAQCMRWRSKAEEPHVTLYLDECHESDSATAALRYLQTEVHGVDRYLEASATFGTGDGMSPFANPRMPSQVTEHVGGLPDPDAIDIHAQEVPWSTARLNGDMLFFIDNQAKAESLVARYTDAGFYSAYLSADMDVKESMGIFDAVKLNFAKGYKSVLVADYTFRSGFTFPSVVRVLDYCEVAFRTTEAGRTVVRYREAYASEIYQAKNRLGRVPNNPGVYVLAVARPKKNMVLLEAAECDVAALYVRALGYKVGTIVQGSPYATGKVPENLAAVLKGRQCVRVYKASAEWPNVDVRPVAPATAEPLELPSPASSQRSSLATVEARPVSVFSIADEDAVTGELTGDLFEKLRRQSLARKKSERIAGGPVQPGEAVVDPNEWDGMMENLRAHASEGLVPMVFHEGAYYGFRSQDLFTSAKAMFVDGPSGVVSAATKLGLRSYLAASSHSVRAEAISVSLVALNKATAKYNAACAMMKVLNGRINEFDVEDADALKSWVSMLRDQYGSARAEFSLASSVLHAVPGSNFRKVSASEHSALERTFLSVFMDLLGACLGVGDTMKAITDMPHDPGDEAAVLEDIMPSVRHYRDLDLRCRVKVKGEGMRGKIVKYLTGGYMDVDMPRITGR